MRVPSLAALMPGLLTVATVLSGCADGTQAESDAGAAVPNAPTVLNQERGAGVIEGVVVDAEGAPIPAARIQILSTTDRDLPLNELATDEAGKFRAEGLAGGGYVVYVSKRDYLDIDPRVITVEDGSTLELRFELDRRRVYVPFHESLPWVRYYLPHFCVTAASTFQCLGPGIYFLGSGTNETYAYDADELASGELHGVVVEMQWQSSMPGCVGGFRSDIYAPDQGTIGSNARSAANPYYWTNVPHVRTPTHLLIPRNGADPIAMHSPDRVELNDGRPLATDGKWQIRTLYHPGPTFGTPADFSCAVEQRVNNWLTAFYVKPPPTDDWSALDDS